MTKSQITYPKNNKKDTQTKASQCFKEKIDLKEKQPS